MATASDRAHPEITQWGLANEPSKELLAAESYWKQIKFVRDVLVRVFARDYDEYKAIEAGISIVGTHHSKSVKLPVYRINLPDGTAFTIRCNFHDWKVSVESPKEVEEDFMDLFDPTTDIDHIYCEGFPPELVFDSYAENKRQFTLEIATDYQLYTFFWIYAHTVLGIR